MSELLAEAITTFNQLERIEQRQQEATAATADLYDVAHTKCESELVRLCGQSGVSLALRIELNEFSDTIKDLDFLQSSGLIEPGLLRQRKEALKGLSQSPVLRLAARMIGGLSLSEVMTEGGTVDEAALSKEIDKTLFFNRRPEQVAADMIGLKLSHKDKQGVILNISPNDEKDNAHWLDSRPLFGSHPVDVYVAPYRGSHMLFFRTAPDTCVRVDQVELGGEKFVRPGQVCRALELNSELCLGVEIVDDAVIIK